ncbi:MAG: response regulator transcription factor [Bacillota bacterium]
MKEIRVLLADDHTLIRDGLKKILALEPGITVVGDAANGREAVQLAAELTPDVILMDINMPEMNGIEAARRIKEQQPHTAIIALTIHEDEEYVCELVSAGISGYLLKDVSADALVDSITQVCAGDFVFHPSVTRKMMGEFRRMAAGEAGERPCLTAREREVLEHVTRGESNREIARRLFISEKTVKNHLTNIFRKIGVEDRTQAVLYALKNRLARL